MNINQEILLFANQYIIMLKRLQPKIAARNCEKVYEGIHKEHFIDFFYLHYRVILHLHTETRGRIEVICNDLFDSTRTPRLISLQQSSSINQITKKAYWPDQSFLQLLLILELINIEDNSKVDEWDNYLAKIPISVIDKKYFNNIIFPDNITVSDLFEKYNDILNPVEYPEYKIDFCKVKTFYENIFYQYRFRVMQGEWNSK